MKKSILRILMFSYVVGSGCGAASSPAGSAQVSWSVFEAADGTANGQPTSCAQVSATTIALALARPSGGAPVVVSLPCARGSGVVETDAGTYSVTPELLGADGTVLATAPSQTVVMAAGQAAATVPLIFGATSKAGFLAISLANGPAGRSNCSPTGAGMTGTALWLERSRKDPNCVALTFARSRAGISSGTYIAPSCSAPSVTTCIETDELLTVGALPPGAYALHARGKKGAVDCWGADQTITVGAGRPSVITLTLAPITAPGC